MQPRLTICMLYGVLLSLCCSSLACALGNPAEAEMLYEDLRRASGTISLHKAFHDWACQSGKPRMNESLYVVNTDEVSCGIPSRLGGDFLRPSQLASITSSTLLDTIRSCPKATLIYVGDVVDNIPVPVLVAETDPLKRILKLYEDRVPLETVLREIDRSGCHLVSMQEFRLPRIEVHLAGPSPTVRECLAAVSEADPKLVCMVRHRISLSQQCEVEKWSVYILIYYAAPYWGDLAPLNQQ